MSHNALERLREAIPGLKWRIVASHCCGDVGTLFRVEVRCDMQTVEVFGTLPHTATNAEHPLGDDPIAEVVRIVADARENALEKERQWSEVAQALGSQEMPLSYFMGVRPGTSGGHYCVPAHGPVTPWGYMHSPLGEHHPETYGRTSAERAERHPARVAQREGEFVHLAVDGWTLIAAWDRSADERGNSMAAIALQGEWSQGASLRLARRRWPRVFARIEGHIGRAVTIRAAQPATPGHYDMVAAPGLERRR